MSRNQDSHPIYANSKAMFGSRKIREKMQRKENRKEK